jgi:signal transduction histidine kinase
VRSVDEDVAVLARWRAWHPWARLAPAAAVLIVALSSSGWKFGLAALYFLASLLAAFHRPWRPHSSALPGYLADWGGLVLCAGFTGVPGASVAAVLFLHLMASALLFRTALEVAAIAAVLMPPWFLLRPDALAALGPAFGAGLALTVAGCWVRTGLLRQFPELVARELEAERQRLAADFHDGPLQAFSSLQIRLEIVSKLLERDPQAASEEVARLRQLGKAQAAEIRAFLDSLRNGPPTLDFRASLLALIRDFERESGLRVNLNGEAPGDWPGAAAALEVLKIVREALHNVYKHAGAARVDVEFARSDRTVELIIRDDGAGFPFAGSYRLRELDALGVGPESIKRRVRAQGGELTVTSQPGAGSELRIRLPA